MYNPDAKDVDLVREYTPAFFALFSRNEMNPIKAFQAQFERMGEESREALFNSGIKCKFLRYAGKMDWRVIEVFYNDGSECKPSPLFVFIYGGLWSYGNHRLSTYMVGPLVKKGYRVALVGYNTIGGTLKYLMEEFCEFVTWIFKYAERTQTTDITFAGHDVGAHLLTQLLHIPGCIPDCGRAKVKSMFFLTGIYDLRELQLLKKYSWICDEQMGIDPSPILWSWKDEAQKWSCLKIHVLTVEHESVTFQEQSRQFSEVLEDAGFNSTFKKFDGLDHYTIITDLKEDKNEITKYLNTAMQKASESSKGSNRPCTCATKR